MQLPRDQILPFSDKKKNHYHSQYQVQMRRHDIKILNTHILRTKFT